MGEAGQTPTGETMEDLIEQTHGPREIIVSGLRFYGGKANAQQLRRYGEIPSRNYHFKKLEKQGVIEQEGSGDTSQGGDAVKVYRLTDLGREVAEAVDSDTSTITEFEDRLTHLEDKIEQMDDLLYEMALHTGVLDEGEAAE